MPAVIRLVLVDDEPAVLSALRRMLLNPAAPPSLEQPVIHTFGDPAQALEHLALQAADVIVSDFRMPRMDGAAFLAEARKLQPDAGRIILSACADMNGVVRAINDAGIFRFIAKPWNDVELKTAVADVLAYRRLVEENRRLADELRAQRNLVTRQQVELARLEADSPGITRVRWSDDGGVLLEP